MNDEKNIENNQELNNWYDAEFERREAELEWSRLLNYNPEMLFELVNGHPRQHVRQG